jgi:hypothetical protein
MSLFYFAIGLTLAGNIFSLVAFYRARVALLSLNHDLTIMLEAQREIRARLDAVEQIGHDVVVATQEKKTWTN